MRRIPLLLVVFAALVCAATGSAQGHVTAISPLTERIGSPYPEDEDSRVDGWFYPGEPVRVVVTVRNDTRETLNVGNQPEWSRESRLVVRRAGPKGTGLWANGPEVELRWTRVAMRPGDDAGLVSIGPGQSRPIKLSLDGNEAALAPGVYALHVMNGREVRFLGIHSAETRAGELNQAFHMATWALSGKDYKSAQGWLQKMLQLNPTSRPALNLLGDVAAATGNCRSAIAWWKKAGEIAALDGDPEAIPQSEWSRGDALRSLQRKIDTCQ